MQGHQPVMRQSEQSPILQQAGNIVLKMNEVQPITTVGKYFISVLFYFHFFLLSAYLIFNQI